MTFYAIENESNCCGHTLSLPHRDDSDRDGIGRKQRKRERGAEEGEPYDLHRVMGGAI